MYALYLCMYVCNKQVCMYACMYVCMHEQILCVHVCLQAGI